MRCREVDVPIEEIRYLCPFAFMALATVLFAQGDAWRQQSSQFHAERCRYPLRHELLYPGLQSEIIAYWSHLAGDQQSPYEPKTGTWNGIRELHLQLHQLVRAIFLFYGGDGSEVIVH